MKAMIWGAAVASLVGGLYASTQKSGGTVAVEQLTLTHEEKSDIGDPARVASVVTAGYAADVVTAGYAADVVTAGYSDRFTGEPHSQWLSAAPLLPHPAIRLVSVD